MEIRKARNWYWWLWLSPVVTVPTLAVFIFLDDDSPIGPIFFSSLWHLFLLIPAFDKENAFVRWHGRQMLLLAGIRTIVPLFFGLSFGYDNEVFWFIPIQVLIWFFGTLWGQHQASHGKCTLMNWLGNELSIRTSKLIIDEHPLTTNDPDDLVEIIRFSTDANERKKALVALEQLELVENLDNAPLNEQDKDTDRQPKSRSKQTLLIGGVLCILVLLCIVLFATNQFTPSNTEATSQPENRVTKQVNLTATAEEQSLWVEVEQAKNWPVVISDSFSSDDKGWMTGYREDESTMSNIAIQNGVYKFNTASNQPFDLWDYPIVDSVIDFFLTVDTRETLGNNETTCGLIFRKTDTNFYAFRINGYDRAKVDLRYFNRWQPLVNQQWRTIKRGGEFNQLSVLAKGQRFYFFINDEFIGETIDEKLSSGRVGIIIGSANSVDRVKCEFDNFELRAP